MIGEHFSPDEQLMLAVSQVTGHEPLLKHGMVTISYQETAISPYKLVAIMESTQDAEMYLGLLIPHNHRWRYRIAEHRTVILL